MSKIRKEIWKPVKGFERRYHVSNHGRLKSTYLIGKHSIIFTPKPLKSGYVKVTLRDRGKLRACFMHRLVAEHFLKKIVTTEQIEIDHRDSNRANNFYKNLRWLTAAQHRKITSEKGEFPRGSENHKSKLSENQVIEARKLFAIGIFQKKMIAEIYGISKAQMTDIINRKNWGWLK